MKTSRCEFKARIVVYDDCIQELDIFTWELEPVGEERNRRRTARDWIEEHLQEWDIGDYIYNFGEDAGGVAFEAVFTGEIVGGYVWTPYGDEYDEEINLDTDMLVQELPEEWFK
ncbi:MAG: hypothetical protein ACYTFQ_04420 [Planctomycetota bacterium]|jgi:hypothetical protein